MEEPVDFIYLFIIIIIIIIIIMSCLKKEA